MAAAWPGSGLARAWNRRACMAALPELFLVISWEIKVWDYPLGLPFKEIIFLHPFILNKLQELWLSEAGICSCSVCIKKVEDFLKHSGLLLNCIPRKQSSIQLRWRTEQWCFWLQTIWSTYGPAWKCAFRYEENAWVGGGSVSRAGCSACAVSAPLGCQLTVRAGFVPWWDSWGYLGGSCHQMCACDSGGRGKLEKQISIFPGGCASVEVVMGLMGWMLQPFLSKLASPCMWENLSWELTSFPQRAFTRPLNTETLEDGYFFKPEIISLDCRNNLILFCWLFKLTAKHGSLMASKMEKSFSWVSRSKLFPPSQQCALHRAGTYHDLLKWMTESKKSFSFHACEVRGWKQRKKAVSSQYLCCTVLNEVSFCFFSSSKSF